MLHQPVKVYKLNPSAPQKYLLKELSTLYRPLKEFSIANYNDRLVYLTGGLTDKYSSMKDVHVFDLIRLEWATAPCMTKGRSNHSSCALGE